MKYLRALKDLPRSTKGVIALVVIIIALSIGISVARSGQSSTNPYDPTSYQSNGLRAAVDTMKALGSQVRVSSQIQGDTVVVFQDNLTTKQENDLEQWTKEGGTVVLATGFSSLSSFTADAGSAFRPRTLTVGCNADWVTGIDRITPGGRTYSMFPTDQAQTACFKDGNEAFVIENKFDLGHVVQIASPDVFTNENLDKTDNAVLLAAVTGASNGSSITLLQRDLTAVADDEAPTLSSLIPNWLGQGLAQIIIAVVVFALWRARRLKALVVEPQPVELPASALTLAVGELLESAGRTDRAARILRAEARQRLAVLFSVDSSIEPRTLITLVADRSGIEERRLSVALLDGPIANSNDLLRLSQELELMQREVANVR